MNDKRFHSIILFIGIFVFSFFPYICRAAIEIDGIWYEVKYGKTATVVNNSSQYSGDIDIPSTFTFNGETYTLTSIDEYAFSDCTDLTSVTIPNSVTSIGEGAFMGCISLSSVTIPSSVTYIGEYAFENTAWYDNQLDGLIYINNVAFSYKGIMPEGTTITIREGTVSISGFAFYGCEGLTSIVIPNTVTSIGEEAFAECANLYSIEIPNSVISIGFAAFHVTPWYYNQPDGLIYINNVAYHYKGDMPEGTGIKIKEGTVSIAECAFSECTGLTSIEIPNTVSCIGDHTFELCRNLRSVVIPNSVTSIGRQAFSGCSSLTNVIIPNNVTIIGPSAFWGCTGLTSLTFSNNEIEIGKDAFVGCTGLISVEIPNNAVIGESAFFSCTGLSSVIIPNSLFFSSYPIFDGCTNLSSVIAKSKIPFSLWSDFFDDINKSTCTLYVPKGSKSAYENAEYWNEFENIVEYELEDDDVLATGQCGDNLTYTIYPDYSMVISGTGEMWDYDYSCVTPDYKDLVKELTIEEGVTDIGAFAFAQFTGITSLTIPNSVTTIGKFSFGYCPGLTSVDFGSGVSFIGNYAFNSCQGLVSLTIPDNVIGIDDYAFAGCSNVTSLTIGSGLRGLGTRPFADCNNLSSIIVDERNEQYDSRDNCNAIINKVNNNILILGCNNSFIPDGVTAIGSYAFSGCTCLTTIEIPNSVTDIDSWAFSGCTGLTSIEIPNSVTGISSWAFSGCTGLTTIVIPNSLTSISDATFSNCTSLTSVVIPNSVTNIWADAFSGCSNMSSIIVGSVEPPVIKTEGVFEGVDKSTCTLFVPSGSKTAYESADYWKDFANILEFRTEDDNPILAMGPCGDHVIYTVYSDMSMTVSGTGNMWNFGESWGFNEGYFHEVENVVVEEGVTSLGDYAFCEYRSSKSISLPNSLTSIGYYAFLGCTNLESLSIPRNVTFIGTGLMNLPILTSDKLASITVDPNNPVYDSRDNCNAIIRTSNNELILGCVNTVIPNSVTSIGHKSFGHCKALTSIEIPNGVTSIGWNAFNGCSNLDAVTVPSSVTFIDSYAFAGTPWLTNQPDGMIYINNVAYIYKGTMPEETCIILNEGTVCISNYAFRNCTNLISVEIPNSVTDIGNAAFSGCSGLTSITMKSNTPTTFKYTAGGASDLTKFYGFDQSACTLYVPYGSKSAYENAACWSKFGNIVEYDPEPDTDISVLDNAIYVDHVDGRIGGAKVVSVKMKDNYDACAFQFVMTVPAGVTITGWNLSSKRLSTTVSTPEDSGKILDEGRAIRVVYSLNGMTYGGDDGEIATINLSFSEDMEEGSYPIYLTECHSNGLFDTSDVPMSDVKATLELADYVEGDANGDGQVLVGDVTSLLNYIVGRPTFSFNEKAADVNGDGVILVGDVTALLNIIVNRPIH